MTWHEQQRHYAETLTDDEFRKAGFTGAARHHPRSENGFRWFCQWNGCDPEKAPPAWRFASNVFMLEYCERRAREEGTS